MQLWSQYPCGSVHRHLLAVQDILRKEAMVQRALQVSINLVQDSLQRQALAWATQDKKLAAFLAIQQHIAAAFAAQPGPFPVSYLPRCQISISTVRQRRGSR